jgi:hypothetical protein
MTHIAALIFGSEEVFGSLCLWAFLSIGAVALFAVFIPLVTWIDSRRKEREAYYKAETFRRMAESSGEGAKAAMEMLRLESKHKHMKMLEGLKTAGVINLFIGIGLTIFLRSLIGSGAGSPWLCGLMPMMVGAAMLVYVYVLARPVE